MKWITLLALTMAVVFMSENSSSSATNHATDEQAIRQLNEECLHAHDIGDTATLDRIEDADFTLSGDFGVINKQQHLEHDRERSNKPSEVITRKIDPQVFRFYGDVALVTETDRPTTKDGSFAYQSSEVWVLRGDAWKLVHLHYSPLTEASAKAN